MLQGSTNKDTTDAVHDKDLDDEGGGILRKVVDGLPCPTIESDGLPSNANESEEIDLEKPNCADLTNECSQVEEGNDNTDETTQLIEQDEIVEEEVNEATEITENDNEIKEDSAIEADDEEIAADTALSEKKEAGAQQDTENENVLTKEDDMKAEDSTEANDNIAISDDDAKPNVSSLIIEEVEISFPDMNSSDIGGENTLGSYTLVDGNTGQKLVDEKDIGNNESIRTEYEIEEVDIECEDPQ